MKRYLLLFFCFMFFSTLVYAQVDEGDPSDSTVIRFYNDTICCITLDTSSMPLWRIGKTHKPFFTTDTNGVVALMTDTLNNYPNNANNWVVLRVKSSLNVIIGFWHRYQTDSGHDGGVVEFSFDHGLTWENVEGPCNINSYTGWSMGVLSSDFYGANDTLITGEASFSGITDSSRYSRFQFFMSPPFKSTSGSGCSWWVDSIYVRFRFLSDSVSDTFAGWIIDSIKLEIDDYHYGGGASNTRIKNSLPISPNPSYTGTFSFPPLKNEQLFTIEVYNILGRKVLNTPYNHTLDISHLPKGLYFYKVTDGIEYYSGRLLYE